MIKSFSKYSISQQKNRDGFCEIERGGGERDSVIIYLHHFKTVQLFRVHHKIEYFEECPSCSFP